MWRGSEPDLRRAITLVDDDQPAKPWVGKFLGIERFIAKQPSKSYRPRRSDGYDDYGADAGSANSNT